MIGSAWSSAVRTLRPWPRCSGGSWERRSGGDEGRWNAAGRTSQSGRKGSGGGEGWGCAGGGEEK